MRMLRFMCATALVCGLGAVAKAQDFQAVVIDPLPSLGEINPIFNQDFPVSLSPCQANQLDGLSTSQFVGCFTGLNLTGKPLTSLEIEFPAIYLPGDILDQPGCPTETQDVFSTIGCGFTSPADTEYYVDFSGGDIPSLGFGSDCSPGRNLVGCVQDSLFTIAIGGIPFADVPQDFTVAANVVTPEPNSFWLMATGVLSVGLFGACRRRPIVGESRS